MNPLPPNVDELVSAYLDGEATPEEVITVESSPELMQRADQIRAVAAQLSAPSTAPLAQKETHIAAALDLFDALSATANETLSPSLAAGPDAPTDADLADTASAESLPTDAPPGVISLEAARSRRRPRRFNTSVIAAAAAVMLLFVAAASLTFGRDNSSDQIATSADSAVEAASLPEPESESADMAADSIAGSALSELDAAQAPANASAMPEIAAVRAAEPDAMAAEQGVASDAMEDEASDQEDAFAGDADNGDQADADDVIIQDDAETGNTQGLLSYLYLGEFDDLASFEATFDEATIEELLEKSSATNTKPGMFLACQSEISELADLEPDEILAEAVLEDGSVIFAEIFLDATTGDGTVIYVVDSVDCSVIAVLEDS